MTVSVSLVRYSPYPKPNAGKSRQSSLADQLPVPVELIYLIRSHKVMLDSDLSELYDVPTKALNQGVDLGSKKSGWVYTQLF